MTYIDKIRQRLNEVFNEKNRLLKKIVDDSEMSRKDVMRYNRLAQTYKKIRKYLQGRK